jgi:hypothetical protein
LNDTPKLLSPLVTAITAAECASLEEAPRNWLPSSTFDMSVDCYEREKLRQSLSSAYLAFVSIVSRLAGMTNYLPQAQKWGSGEICQSASDPFLATHQQQIVVVFFGSIGSHQEPSVLGGETKWFLVVDTDINCVLGKLALLFS